MGLSMIFKKSFIITFLPKCLTGKVPFSCHTKRRNYKSESFKRMSRVFAGTHATCRKRTGKNVSLPVEGRIKQLITSQFI